MEVLHGTISDCSPDTRKDSTATVYGQGVAMTQVVSAFRVGLRQVRFQSDWPKSAGAMVTAGDEVVLAGRSKSDGVFEALAYRNLTTKVSGTSQSLGFLVFACMVLIGFGVLFLVAAFPSKNNALWGSTGSPVWLFLALPCLGAGVWRFTGARTVSEAERLCGEWAATNP